MREQVEIVQTVRLVLAHGAATHAAHIGHALENWMKIASGLPEDKNSPGPRSTAVFAAIGRLFRQPDAIRVPPFAFVLLGKNFFEPMGLMLSDCLIHNSRIVKDNKFLTATVTAKSTHLSKAERTLSHLTFFYRYGSHLKLLHSSGTLTRRC